MENLIISFNVVLPLFICIMLGYFLRRIKMFDGTALKQMNKLCFKVFLPIYLFNSVYSTNLTEAFNVKLILFAVSGLFLVFFGAMIIVPKLEKDNAKRGVMVQGIFRSNFALFGLPLATSLCGEDGIGPTSLLLGIVVPIVNVLAVVTLETFRGGKPDVKKILKGIATNPLIIACLLGAIFNMLKINIPSAVQKSLTDLGRVATPLSLVVLGGEFVFGKVQGYIKQLSVTVAGKLIIAPLIMVTLGVLLGFRDNLLVPILIMFGAPTAVSSFTMAEQMGGDGELAAEVVVFTSGLCILTMFVWIFVLKQFGVM